MASILKLYFYKVDWIGWYGEEKKLPELDFSPRQLFWLSYARLFCSVSNNFAVQNQAQFGMKHAPGEFRVIGVAQNNHEFSKDFNCGPNSKMNSRTKCEVW